MIFLRYFCCSLLFLFLPIFSPPSYRGSDQKTHGKAFVVYEDIYDAKNAVDHLTGFNVGGRFLVCTYHKMKTKVEEDAKKGGDMGTRRQELDALKAKYGVDGIEKKN